MSDPAYEVAQLATEAVKEKIFPGCVIGIVRANGPSTSLRTSEREVWPFGSMIYHTDQRVREDTVYDLASITKSIPTASLALTCIAEGKFRLTDKVTSFLPELRNDCGATIEDLLRYRVKGVQMSTLKHKTFEKIRTHVFETGFDGPPGDGAYTNLPAFLLGLILERTGGESLAALAHRYFFEPLSMKSTTYFPVRTSAIYRTVAPTEIAESGEEIAGLPHDESAHVFAKARRAAGHAGLFSTCGDLLHFLEALLQGKFPHVVDGAQKGLGWQVNDAQCMGKFASAKTFGKTGFTGTSMVCDVERGIAFVILSNRTYPKRPADDSAIYNFRSTIADSIFST